MNQQLGKSFLLVLTATIWGLAFVAQSVGMDHVGPITFTASRSILAAIALFFLAGVFDRFEKPAKGSTKKSFTERWKVKRLWTAGFACGAFLLTGTLFQQYGLLFTTVGKASFVTSLYIVLVPLIGLLIGRKPTRLAILALPFAIVGLFFLCVKEESLALNPGDILMFFGAFAFTGHILTIDRVSNGVDAVRMSAVQFLFCSVVGSAAALIFEEVYIGDIIDAAAPILYAGFLSSAVGYTLQIVAQRGLNPTVASLLMSLESVVGVLAGWLLLDQLLNAREIGGCVLMAVAIVLAQLPEDLLWRKEKSSYPKSPSKE